MVKKIVFKILTPMTPNVVYEHMARRTFDVIYFKKHLVASDKIEIYLPFKSPHRNISDSKNCLNTGLQNVHLIRSSTSRGLYYVTHFI